MLPPLPTLVLRVQSNNKGAASRVSVLVSVTMVWGRYLVFGYLDLEGTVGALSNGTVLYSEYSSRYHIPQNARLLYFFDGRWA